MPRDISDDYKKLFKDPEQRETRYIEPDGKFSVQKDAGLHTAKDLSSTYLYRGAGSDRAGGLHGRYYSPLKVDQRDDVLHRLDTESLLVRKADIGARKKLPRTPKPSQRSVMGSGYNDYSEADLGDPDRETGFGAKLLGGAIAFGLGLAVYRGARGAGFYPFRKEFFQPLKTIQRNNVIRTTSKALGLERGQKLTAEEISMLVEPAMKRGYGLRTTQESLAYLFTRTIEGIPEFLDYAGFGKSEVRKAFGGLSRFILGGTPSKDPGFYRASSKYISQALKEGFKPGPRTLGAAIGKITTRAVLPAYAGMLGYSYLDYRVRKAKALDETPLSEGITAFGADMWVKSRMFMQKTLDNLGVLNAHKHAQTNFPGYLRAAGLAAGAAAGIAKKLPFTGLLMTAFAGGVAGYAAERGLSRTPEELEKIYSGEESIPIRSGRWWEFGRTPFEGGRISYYRPHWYPLLKSRYKEKGSLYPSEDWKWQNHWLIGPLTGNKFDPYAWEKKYYKERPYPVTGAAFEDVPLIGPILEATVGRIVKPRRLMHTEEWLGAEGAIPQPEEAERIRRITPEASRKLGLKEIPRAGMGDVLSPSDIRHTIGEQAYRATEWMGLPGFYLQEAVDKITGKESFFEQARLQGAQRATGYEREYWDTDLGGLLGTTEVYRRFFPHRRRQIEEYNPIENLMGQRHEWLPGPEYFIDFKHGDPFIKVPVGEARLPGTGYEALHELHSNIPGVYDAVDRFLILADVAPYSEQYKHYRAIVNMWSRSGVIDVKWKGKVTTSREQRQARMKRYNFQPRRFSRIKQQVDAALTSDNEGKKSSVLESAAKGWESITHTISNVPIPGLSFLTTKIIPTRTPIEHYERFQVFGRESAFWGHPIRDFAKVYYQEVRGMFQPTWIPPDVSKKREIEEYFDKLEYIKYKQLEQRSEEENELDLARAFNKRSKETLHGLNPYGSWSNIYRAMPRAERDYFGEFVEAQGPERERIRELVPDYMRRIYEAQWQIKDVKADRKTESKRVEKKTNEDLSEFFAERYLPGKNWLGWHPDVDLEKVKLKVVKNEAMDIHDFNLWRSQEEAAKREPTPFIRDYKKPNPYHNTPVMRAQLIEELTRMGFSAPEIEITTAPSARSTVNMDFDVEYDQSEAILKRARGRVPSIV